MSFVEQVRQQLNTKNVGIVEFAESDEYCNKPLFPRQRVLLKLMFLEEMDGYEEDVLTEWLTDGEARVSPLIRERREYLIENGYKHFPEVVLVGGRRSSKGYIGGISMTKLMYNTWMLGDPGKYYGIDPQKEIYFSCVASALTQAKAYQYADFVNTVTSCKPFIKSDHGLAKVQEESFSVHTPSDKLYVDMLRKMGVTVGRNFAKLKGQPMASNADSIRGSATMGIVFDEMAFMETVEGNRSSASECYAAAEPSLAQFGKDGMIMCFSSPYTKIGKFFERYANSMEVLKDGTPAYPLLMSLQFPSWELFKDYRKPKAWLSRAQKRTAPYPTSAIMVSPDVDSETLGNEDDKIICLKEQFTEKSNPDKYKVERRAQWAEVVSAYLTSERVDEAFAAEFRGRPIHATFMGNYQFQPYVMHCDPSSTTAGFGFAIGHIEEFPNDLGIIESHVVFDLVKRWNPADFENHTIDYMEVVLPELLHYCKLYRPVSLTFDQFNSVAPIQWLQKHLSMERLSVRVGEETATKQRNWNRYELFKTALNLGLIHIPPDCPDSEYASLELKFLQKKNGAVEKQDIGPIQTKDIADCIAEVSRVLLASIMGYGSMESNAHPSLGAQGGYPIGGSAAQQANGGGLLADYYRERGMRINHQPNRARTAYRPGRR